MSDNDLRLKKEKAKKMMLLFALLSITMTFGGLTSAYVVSKGRPDWLVDFALPKSFVYSTFVIVLSSITIQLSKYFLNKEKSKNRSLIFLSTTFILGIIFLVLQFNGFNNLIDLGYYFAGAQSNVTTSFIYVLAFVHLLHLIAGLVVVSVLFYNTYFDNYSDSILGFSLGVTFWHFLDLLWVYLFIFLYFIG